MILRLPSIAGFLAFLAIALHAPAALAQGASDPRTPEGVIAAIDADPRFAGFLRQCPADLYKRALHKEPDLADDYCDGRLGECLASCRDGGSGEHCLTLARSFQRDREKFKPIYAEMLFAAACARGHGAGCTNRGAGMRNGRYEGDPFLARSERVQEQCQFRSFKRGCDREDAWGCAMLAQAYASGEGVKRSKPQARAAARKSCRIAPDFEACSFGKEAAND